MKIKPDALSVNLGIAGSGVSMTWNATGSDAIVAHRVITFLEDRRVLFGQRHLHDGLHCVLSVQEIRTLLTEQLGRPETGAELASALRAMRAACRQFVDAAGPDAEAFRAHDGVQSTQFGLALGDLRTLFGIQIARIASTYDLEIETTLAAICPPPDLPESEEQDLSWLPGVE